MIPMPFPSPDAVAIDDSETVELGGAQKAEIVFEPTQSGSTFYSPVVAISKHPDSSYEIRMDEKNEWGPASLPPTDVDDMVGIWTPAKEFQDQMTVIIKNLSGTTRTYHVQPLGWEE